MAATTTLQVTTADLAALRARMVAVDDSACPRCQSADACPAWCVDADGEAEDAEPTDCDLGDHDLVELSYDAPVSTQRCQTCGHEVDVDMTGDIEAACVEERERALYGVGR